MTINENEHTSLYGLDDFFLELSNLYDNKKFPNKILLSGKKGLGKCTLAKHLINYILSKEEEFSYDKKKFKINKENKSFILCNNNSNPNFFLIDVLKEKKNIEINQVRELITNLNKSCFNNKPRFILIDNIEFLNKNSSNAILKILEEPNENIFFILINNNKKILSTLSSRCLNFKIHISANKIINIANEILKISILDHLNKDLINYYNTPGDYYNLFKFANINKIDLLNYNIEKLLNYIINNNLYKKDPIVKTFVYNYMELFLLKVYKSSNIKNSILEFYYSFIKKINDYNKFNLDEESLFLEFKSKVLNG